MSRDQSDSKAPAAAADGADSPEPRHGPAEQLRPPTDFSLGDPIEKLKHCEVVVHANGILYRGTLGARTRAVLDELGVGAR